MTVFRRRKKGKKEGRLEGWRVKEGKLGKQGGKNGERKVDMDGTAQATSHALGLSISRSERPALPGAPRGSYSAMLAEHLRDRDKLTSRRSLHERSMLSSSAGLSVHGKLMVSFRALQKNIRA